MSSEYVRDYKQAEDELKQYGVDGAREELRITLSAYREESPDARPEAILKEAVRNIKIEVTDEREWRYRENEFRDIPSWMDEERITVRRYEEGPQERYVDAYGEQKRLLEEQYGIPPAETQKMIDEYGYNPVSVASTDAPRESAPKMRVW